MDVYHTFKIKCIDLSESLNDKMGLDGYINWR